MRRRVSWTLRVKHLCAHRTPNKPSWYRLCANQPKPSGRFFQGTLCTQAERVA